MAEVQIPRSVAIPVILQRLSSNNLGSEASAPA
jgi:hypothetical protein